MDLTKKLGIGALVFGLAGCSGVKNITTDYLGDKPFERFVVSTAYTSDCHQAEVFMSKDRYIISCDDQNYFTHRVNSNGSHSTLYGTNDGGNYLAGNLLVWNGVVYFDKDMDDVLDFMTVQLVDYSKEEIKPEQNEIYKELVDVLSRNQVQETWEVRWETSEVRR